MKKLIRNIRLIAAFTPLLSLGLVSGVAHAAGTATYSLVQSGNSVSIYEDSGSTAVNTIQAELSYGGTQPVSVNTSGSPFSSCITSTSSEISCTILGGGSVTNSQLVGTLNFGAGTSTQVSLAQNSIIASQSPAADVWDHATVSASYSFAAPAAPAPRASTPAPAAVTTPAPAPATPAVKATSTKKAPASTKLVSSASDKKNSYVVGEYILLIVILAAAVTYEVRRRMVLSKEAALASTYKMPAGKKASTKSKTKASSATMAAKKASTSKTVTKKTSKK